MTDAFWQALPDTGAVADLSDHVFYPLSLYNDAALRAIDGLHRQFLFLEVEGEVKRE